MEKLLSVTESTGRTPLDLRIKPNDMVGLFDSQSGSIVIGIAGQEGLQDHHTLPFKYGVKFHFKHEDKQLENYSLFTTSQGVLILGGQEFIDTIRYPVAERTENFHMENTSTVAVNQGILDYLNTYQEAIKDSIWLVPSLTRALKIKE